MNRPRVLFIDDDATHMHPLLKAGWEVCFAPSLPAVQAYIEASRHGFDVVCLDCHMHPWSGLDIAKEVLIHRGFPIVLHSQDWEARREVARLLSEHERPHTLITYRPNSEFADRIKIWLEELP